MRHSLSGSKWWLAQACAYWARADVVCPSRPVGLPAVYGTETHAHVEHVQRLRMGQAPMGTAGGVLLTDHEAEVWPMVRQANAYLETLDVPTHVEIPIIYNAETDRARLAEMDGPRGYRDVGPMDIPTTLDLLWVGDEDSLDVVDLKTGQERHAHPEQLDLQALAASRLFGKTHARVGFLFARKTKVIPPKWRELDEDALAGEAFLAASVMRSLPMAQPQPGAHCWTCPLGRDACPAHQAPSAEDMAEAFASVG